MRLEVNGVRLFFDVEGASRVPDGAVMREKPTLLLLHGGPGFDHSVYKPAFSQYTDVCQVVYLDHRGNGRSDNGTSSTWNLAQWGDDIHAFCEALEIEKPIVLGLSFGGFVAQSYATRHPEHPGKLILASTAARGHGLWEWRIRMFEQLGGKEAGDIVRRRSVEGGTPEIMADWRRVCMPLYMQTPQDADAAVRTVRNDAVLLAFNELGAEGWSFDFRTNLAAVQCPTLVLGGELDPMTPIQCSEEIANCLPSQLVRLERFPRCGHGVFRDDPHGYDVIRDFILS